MVWVISMCYCVRAEISSLMSDSNNCWESSDNYQLDVYTYPKILTYCHCLIHQPTVDTARSFCSLYCKRQRRQLMFEASLNCLKNPLGGRILQSMKACGFSACNTNDISVYEWSWMDATFRGGARLLLHALVTPVYITREHLHKACHKM